MAQTTTLPSARPRRGSLLAPIPVLTVLVMLGPVAAGTLGSLLPAFGFMPALGLRDWGLGAFRELLAWPGLPRAMWLSVATGFAATGLSLAIVALTLASVSGTRWFALVQRALSPLLSVPHAAAAFGLAFLIAPSGWIARALSPAITGWDKPPDLLIVQDPYGLSLIAGLVVKEVPFLLLMSIAALGQAAPARSMVVAQALGYGRETGWLRTVFPRVYAQIRLPVFVVLAFSMSVVDVAVILGPNTPPTLAVQIVKWMGDPDLSQRLVANAAALLQLALVLGGIALWIGGERVCAALSARAIFAGRRGRSLRLARPLILTTAALTSTAVLVGLLGLFVWSIAGFWSFPDLLPQSFTDRSWMRHGPALTHPAMETCVIAALSALLALALVLGCLEAEDRTGKRLSPRGAWLLYLPLLIPQIAFLPGLQTLMLQCGITGGRIAVVLGHLVFVIPYVFLSLSDPYRALDRRYATIGHALGHGPARVFWRVKLPLLLAPVLTALAVGFAVSVGQYLPTLLIGGGRVQSLTTEAVALAAGGDRRAIGVYGLAQTAAALVPFALATVLPALIYARRKGVLHAG